MAEDFYEQPILNSPYTFTGRFWLGEDGLTINEMVEFVAVVVMACDDEAIPLQSRVENWVEESELEKVYITERHLLYVACTRARDHLFVTGIIPDSEFLEDVAL